MDFDYDEVSMAYVIMNDALKYASHILCVIDQKVIA